MTDDKEKYLKDYTMVHNSIIRTNKLSVYEKCCITNILSNKEDFKIPLSVLASRMPCSRDKCIKTINLLKENKLITVFKTKTLSGDWDSNSYKLELDKIFNYIEVVVEKDNVVFNKDYVVVEKDNGSIQERQQVVVEKDNKNTNKNTNKNKEKSNINLNMLIAEYTQNECLRETLKDFLKMRKAIKKTMTDRALKIMLKKLKGFSNDEDIQIKILEQSILNSWQGIFPLKDQSEKNTVNHGTSNKNNCDDLYEELM